MSDFEQFSWKVRAGTALSQFVNAVFLNGHPDMSISTRAYLKGGWIVDLIDTVMGDGHCEAAWTADLNFADDMLRSTRNSERA